MWIEALFKSINKDKTKCSDIGTTGQQYDQFKTQSQQLCIGTFVGTVHIPQGYGFKGEKEPIIKLSMDEHLLKVSQQNFNQDTSVVLEDYEGLKRIPCQVTLIKEVLEGVLVYNVLVGKFIAESELIENTGTYFNAKGYFPISVLLGYRDIRLGPQKPMYTLSVQLTGAFVVTNTGEKILYQTSEYKKILKYSSIERILHLTYEVYIERQITC